MSNSGVSVPIGHPSIGWVVACSQRGSSHYLSNDRCQDAHSVWSAGYSGSAGVVIAVADGHGDKQHDLSHVGAALAVRVANEVLAGVFGQLKLGTTPELSPGSFLRRVCEEYPRRVCQRWRDEVREHDQLMRQAQTTSRQGQDVELRRYGTTLLSALLTEEMMLFAQLGDGILLWVPDEGEIEQKFPPSDDLNTNETDSMCSEKADLLMRVGIARRLGSGILILATDGFVNAFAKGGIEQYARSLSERIQQYRPEEVAAALPDWLDDCSKRGSGDDVTVAVARVGTAPVLTLQATRATVERERAELEMRFKEDQKRLEESLLEDRARIAAMEQDLDRDRKDMLRRHQEKLAAIDQLKQQKLQELERRKERLGAHMQEKQKAIDEIESVQKSMVRTVANVLFGRGTKPN
jgi:serine/threonine protein phosphatase PrpC